MCFDENTTLPDSAIESGSVVSCGSFHLFLSLDFPISSKAYKYSNSLQLQAITVTKRIEKDIRFSCVKNLTIK